VPAQRKSDFFESAIGVATRQTLIEMVADSSYKTDSSYSANATLYPSKSMTFVEKHMDYLKAHPATDPDHYLSNLRLMTRIR
jgi:hypothetical protein